MTGVFMHGALLTYGLLAALAIALAVAAVTDIQRRQIDNWLTGAIALGAPLFWWACGLGVGGIGGQLLSAAICFLVLWAMFVMRLMGGGDVKLLAALALWIKPAWFLNLVMTMAVLGGVLSVALAVWHLAHRRHDRLSVPYGIAISGAGLWILVSRYLPALQAGGSIG